MSLYKQLWLSIAFLMIVAFIGSFFVSCYSAKSYLEEQLYRKNIDNASTLALTLSNESHDTTTIELLVNAQFDSGHYEWIRIVDTEGQVIVEKTATDSNLRVPSWIIRLFTIDAPAGVAQISDGWRQLGTLSLASTTRFAYSELWITVQRLFYYFLAVAILAGIFGSLLLRMITRPLDKAVSHAEAIGERRFITTDEPRTKEFKAVIRSMNKLSTHVKSMLDEEMTKLDKLRFTIQIDAVTGLLSREPVLNHLHSYLQADDSKATGLLVTIRIADLFRLNQEQGRLNIDALLKRFGDSLHKHSSHFDGVAGRLNGSDFLVVLPECDEQKIGFAIMESLRRDCQELKIHKVQFLGSSTFYHAGETVSQLLRRMDSVLESSANKDTAPFIHIAADPKLQQLEGSSTDWKQLLHKAMEEKRFVLELFPVRTIDDQLLHEEAPVRLVQEDGSLLHAGVFMPHISRLRLGEKLDLIVLKLALKKITLERKPIGINLSASLLMNSLAMAELTDVIKAHRDESEKLWLEIPEYGAFQNMDNFRVLCQMLKPLKCKIGIEHVAKEFTRIGELHDLGLDYIKIDRSLIHNIDTTTSVQVFLRGLCTIVHSIGLKAIAEGVEREAEWLVLQELGLDGGTGEYFPRPI